MIYWSFKWCRTVAKNFQMEMDYNMTFLEGRVLGAPVLRLGTANGNVYPVRVDLEKCNWNLDGKSVVEGKPIERWALIDFTLLADVNCTQKSSLRI